MVHLICRQLRLQLFIGYSVAFDVEEVNIKRNKRMSLKVLYLFRSLVLGYTLCVAMSVKSSLS